MSSYGGGYGSRSGGGGSYSNGYDRNGSGYSGGYSSHGYVVCSYYFMPSSLIVSR